MGKVPWQYKIIGIVSSKTYFRNYTRHREIRKFERENSLASQQHKIFQILS